MTLLSRPEILAALEAGDIIIDPFDERNLGTASYDVTIGPYVWREEGATFTATMGCAEVLVAPELQEYNPYQADPYGGCDWRRDEALPPAASWKTQKETSYPYGEAPPHPINGSHEGDRYIWLAPGELVLAHTIEFIGSTRGRGDVAYTTQMHSRSTTVRMGLDVCGSGGWGDHGFCNRWTMEIRNNLRFHHVPLIVGRRVAQISFFKTAPIEAEQTYAEAGKYCTGSIEEMQQGWAPEQMLPAAYKDREVTDPSYQEVVNALFKNT